MQVRCLRGFGKNVVVKICVIKKTVWYKFVVWQFGLTNRLLLKIRRDDNLLRQILSAAISPLFGKLKFNEIPVNIEF